MNRYLELNKITFSRESLLEEYNKITDFAFYGKVKKTGLHAAYGVADDVVAQLPDGVVENVKFLKTLAGGIVHTHTDSRNVAINIPVQIHETSMLQFFEGGISEDVPVKANGKRFATKAKNIVGADLVDEILLEKAILLNVGMPHGVDNTSSPYDRVILSISLTEEYNDWEKACTVLSTLM